MSRAVRLLPEAEGELFDAAQWYERERTGLGAAFITRVRQAFERLADHPEHHAIVHRDVRMAFVAPFPYVILYRAELDGIVVVAVFHTSRDSAAWKSRS